MRLNGFLYPLLKGMLRSRSIYLGKEQDYTPVLACFQACLVCRLPRSHAVDQDSLINKELMEVSSANALLTSV